MKLCCLTKYSLNLEYTLDQRLNLIKKVFRLHIELASSMTQINAFNFAPQLKTTERQGIGFRSHFRAYGQEIFSFAIMKNVTYRCVITSQKCIQYTNTQWNL